jgi:hypothetical protein
MKKKKKEDDLWAQRVNMLLLTHDSWMTPKSVNSLPSYNLSDEEVYYITIVINELSTVQQKRAIFDIIHAQCTADTLKRFMGYWPKTTVEEIMFTC